MFCYPKQVFPFGFIWISEFFKLFDTISSLLSPLSMPYSPTHISTQKILPGNGDHRTRYWLPVSLDRTREHVIQRSHRRWFVTKAGANAPVSCRHPETSYTAAFSPGEARKGDLFKGGDMGTTNPSCCQWTPGSF